jgi:hypothetical protein
MEPRYTALTKLTFGILAAVFAVQAYEAATRPIGTGEAYIYDRFVRPANRQVLAQELPDRDVLYSLLEKRSVGLFHVSPFSVRLPGLLFAILYLWSVWRIGRWFPGTGRLFPVVVVLAGLLPLGWGWFWRANGAGTALALALCAAWLTIRYLKQNQVVNPLNLNLAGACLGLSVAARLDFAIPVVLLGLLFLAAFAIRKQWAVWADRLLVPAAVVALVFLVLPVSHSHAASENTPELTVGESSGLQSALQVLRASAGSSHIRIGAMAAVEPIVNFYRAQHRLTTWGRAQRNFASTRMDYYLLPTSDLGWVEQRHLIVLYRDAGLLLAHRSYDAM